MKFPEFINENIFTLELGGFVFSLTWYSLSYIIGLLVAWKLMMIISSTNKLWSNNTPVIKPEKIEELMTVMILGVILGGRLGYIFFYNLEYYITNPIKIFYVWEGGMSFHGGFMGVILGGLYYSKRNSISPFSLGDLIAISSPPGLFLGRIANFINQELWGRPTTSQLGVVFSKAEALICPPSWEHTCARHPSQLYEASLEGLLLGVVMMIVVVFFNGLKVPGRMISVFLIGYGLSRIFVEYFREADVQYISNENPDGYILTLTDTLGFTMGQSLSIPMVVVGLILLIRSMIKKPIQT